MGGGEVEATSTDSTVFTPAASASRRCPKQISTISMPPRSRPWIASGSGWRRTTRSTCSPMAVVMSSVRLTSCAIPAHIVEESIAKAPSSFVLCGRDPEDDVLLEPGRVCFANFTEGLEVNDLRTGEHRVSVKQDIADAMIVVDAMSEIDLALLPVAARDCEHASERARVRRRRTEHHQARARAGDQQGRDGGRHRDGRPHCRGHGRASRAADHERGLMHRQPAQDPSRRQRGLPDHGARRAADAAHGHDARRGHRPGHRRGDAGRAERGGARGADARPARGAGRQGDLRLVDRWHGPTVRGGCRRHPGTGADQLRASVN